MKPYGSYATQLDLDSEDSTSPADLTNQLNVVMMYTRQYSGIV